MQTALRAIAVTVQTMDAQCNPRDRCFPLGKCHRIQSWKYQLKKQILRCTVLWNIFSSVIQTAVISAKVRARIYQQQQMSFPLYIYEPQKFSRWICRSKCMYSYGRGKKKLYFEDYACIFLMLRSINLKKLNACILIGQKEKSFWAFDHFYNLPITIPKDPLRSLLTLIINQKKYMFNLWVTTGTMN